MKFKLNLRVKEKFKFNKGRGGNFHGKFSQRLELVNLEVIIHALQGIKQESNLNFKHDHPIKRRTNSKIQKFIIIK